MRKLLPKVLLIALIIAIPSIFMLVLNNEKMATTLTSLNIPTATEMYNRIIGMIMPKKELPPSRPEIKPDELYCKISEINQENPGQSSSYVKKYTKIFDITENNPDLRVDYVDPFVPTSSSHYLEGEIKVSPDRTKVIVTFTLVSGPANDKYTGWVDGMLTVHTKTIKSASAAK